MATLTKKITERAVLRVMIGGFLLVLLVLVISGLNGLSSLHGLQVGARELSTEFGTSSDLIAQMQRQIAGLNAIVHRLWNEPEAIDETTLLALVQETESNISRIAIAGAGTQEEAQWRELAATSRKFTAQVRQALESQTPTATIRTLAEQHQDLIAHAASLINGSYQRAVGAQAQMDRELERLVRETLFVVMGCVLIGSLLAFFTLLLVGRLIRNKEHQEEELNRVSWLLVENREATARRFSHELHDELGQSLTAIKANLATLGSTPNNPSRLADCVTLVDEAIENVREMSQLLHPRVLDDFGLDVALRSLAEKLSERTNIEIDYETNLTERLPIETATHLYRVGQEALTNVVRHSKATKARMSLRRDQDQVTLSVEDNGVGIPETRTEHAGSGGMGMIAMGARARHLGGSVTVDKSTLGGLLVEVQVPVKGSFDEFQSAGLAR